VRLVLPAIADKLGFKDAINESNIHIAHALLALLIITILGIIFKRYMRNIDERIVPAKKPSLVGFIEIIAEAILRLMESIIGKDARQFYPLIGALFFYILISNLIGLIPGFIAATDNINTNVACSLTVFVYYNYVGIKKNGIKNYLKEFMGPVIWLAPLMFVIELISHVVRPVSLSVRLFGNMIGDHMVLQMFSSIIPLLLPIPFLFLGLFVALIQAFVFTLLSIIYISLAMGTHGHEDTHDEQPKYKEES